MSKKYAAFNDGTGEIIGFFSDDINPPEQIASVKTIEITVEEWETCLDQRGCWSVVNGKLFYCAPYHVTGNVRRDTVH
jgi:hypothetical protein